MVYVFISLTALLASFLTFFSGFGLGTILLPVFALFFNLPTAIALTAVVHLLNNIFKLMLVHKNIHFATVFKFGVPALVASFAGAWVLNKISYTDLTLLQYQIQNNVFSINWQGLVIGTIVLLFSIVELSPALSKITFGTKWALPGGLLTGFFGGLSGHQGALRSAFLLRLLPDKAMFIASGVAIACLVDFARLSMYQYNTETITNNAGILITAILSAFAGALIGNRVFKKTSVRFLKLIVGLFMLTVSILMMTGIINK